MQVADAELPAGAVTGKKVTIAGYEPIADTDYGNDIGTFTLNKPTGMKPGDLWLVYIMSRKPLPESFFGFTKIGQSETQAASDGTIQYGAWFWRTVTHLTQDVKVYSNANLNPGNNRMGGFGLAVRGAEPRDFITKATDLGQQLRIDGTRKMQAIANTSNDVLAMGFGRLYNVGTPAPTVTFDNPAGATDLVKSHR
jgi:hypothetical protein